MQDSKALTPTEKVLICLSVHLIVVHEPAADLRDLLVVGGGQHEPAELPHARGLHVEGPVHGGGVRLSPGEVAVLPRQLLMVTGHTGHLASPVSQLNLNQFAATSPASPAQPSTAQATGFHQPARQCCYIWDWLPPTAHNQAFYNKNDWHNLLTCQKCMHRSAYVRFYETSCNNQPIAIENCRLLLFP